MPAFLQSLARLCDGNGSSGNRASASDMESMATSQAARLIYPLGCQLEDGRISIACYFNRQDGNGQGQTRDIAATIFRLSP